MNFFLQTQLPKTDGPRQKRKFSTYFKSLVIELDRELYGPDNHLVEVNRTVTKFLLQGTRYLTRYSQPIGLIKKFHFCGSFFSQQNDKIIYSIFNSSGIEQVQLKRQMASRYVYCQSGLYCLCSSLNSVLDTIYPHVQYIRCDLNKVDVPAWHFTTKTWSICETSHQ